MNLGQLTEYNMRNIFIENHRQNVAEELFADPFLILRLHQSQLLRV